MEKSRSSFLLNTLEKQVDLDIKVTTDIIKQWSNHYSYLKGKWVESALHKVFGTKQKTLQDKEYTLAAFLGIDGAYNKWLQ